MIKNTFCIFKGISKKKEKELWNIGIKSWDDFLRIDKIKGISNDKKKNYDMQIKKVIMKLEYEEHDYFIKLLPVKLHYRYYPIIKDELIYLDIESYGHNRKNEITIIGLGNGEHTRLLRGDSTDSTIIRSIIDNCKGIITYNGRSYDLPILKKRYHIDFNNKFIIDLKHLMQELEYIGGLKQIEKELGIRRELSYKIMNGDPINLWKAYKATEEPHFIELLAEYVEADVNSLPTIIEFAYKKYKEKYSIS